MAYEVAAVARLPNELLLHIFTYLDESTLACAALACRFWARLSLDDSLWRERWSLRFATKSDNHSSPGVLLMAQLLVRSGITHTSRGTWKSVYNETQREILRAWKRRKNIRTTSLFRNETSKEEPLAETNSEYTHSASSEDETPRGRIHCLQIRGDVLLSGSSDGLLRLWSTQQRQCLRTISCIGKGEVTSARIDGQYLVCNQLGSGRLYLWDANGRLVCGLSRPDSKNRVRGNSSRRKPKFERYDRRDGDADSETDVPFEDDMSEPYHNDGESAEAAASSSSSGDESSHGNGGHRPKGRRRREKPAVLSGHSPNDAEVLCVDICRHVLASGHQDGVVGVWRLEDGGETVAGSELSGHVRAVTCVQFVHDYFFAEEGRSTSLLISGSRDGTLRLWDVEYGQCVQKVDAHRRQIACLQATGPLVLSGSSDSTAKLWDLRIGRLRDSSIDGGAVGAPPGASGSDAVCTLAATSGRVECVGFDEIKLMTSGADRAISLFDRRAIRAHARVVRELQRAGESGVSAAGLPVRRRSTGTAFPVAAGVPSVGPTGSPRSRSRRSRSGDVDSINRVGMVTKTFAFNDELLVTGFFSEIRLWEFWRLDTLFSQEAMFLSGLAEALAGTQTELESELGCDEDDNGGAEVSPPAEPAQPSFTGSPRTPPHTAHDQADPAGWWAN